MAETLRQAIAGSPHVTGTNSISLTVSIGVAWARRPDRVLTPAALVQAADQRLYEAKQAGRNTSRPIFYWEAGRRENVADGKRTIMDFWYRRPVQDAVLASAAQRGR